MIKKEAIERHSGVSLKLHTLVSPLKKGQWVELDFNVGGDAPKNFLAIYEYTKNSGIRRANSATWPKYIAKVGHKWYPIESINEYLFNQLGEAVGLNMASSKLVLINGQLRFLSKYFLKKDESLVHGAEIFAGYLSDQEFVESIEQQKLARKFFTFEFTKTAITNMFPDTSQPIMESFVRMLVFDAITGNNDRHFYNWGVIKDVKGKKSPKFAPIYDSARGLFWNDEETKLETWFKHPKQINDRIEKYAEGSRPKIGWDGLDDLNHFELIEKVFNAESDYQDIIVSLVDKSNLESMSRILKVNFISYLTKNRMELIQRCLQYRFKRLNEIVH